ncbi:MAG: hypothetical protein KKD56_07690 [Acidobacteria bacterium]|nr:hypothetical protein [Acidobacteriota bacterium]
MTGTVRIPRPCSIALIVFTLLSAGCGKTSIADREFASHIQSGRKSLSVRAGRRIPLSLTVTNRGTQPWIKHESHPFSLSYHLLDRNGEMLHFENRRYPLPERVEPGQAVSLDITLQAPLDHGRYRIEFDVVEEGIAWFRDRGSASLKIGLEVTKNDWPGIPAEDVLNPDAASWFETADADLNRPYPLIRLTLEETEVEFQGKTGALFGFSPGEDYPQIWLRDAATILPASRLFYGREYLSSWLEEHLAQQKEDGSLYDWMNSRGETDTNTTETDQEASAVQAAFQVYQILGAEWLEKAIAGTALIDRLIAAMESVRTNRMDPTIGLLKGAHTADWGDVDLVDKDEKAVYTDERTIWTADIYDQSMFVQASRELSRMLTDLGRNEEALGWDKTAGAVTRAARTHLWMEDRGYFRVHIHLVEHRHGFNEDAILAMGGNTQAILSGIADDSQAASIIKTILERRKEHGVSTVSGTLYPPYPKNTFQHPMMDDPYEYQNGAQWDWFGGRLIQAMFEGGFASTARDELLAIAKKVVQNGGFYEWDNKEGVGRGSAYFAGSAGVLAKALVEGYFGVRLSARELGLTVRLGRESGKIHVRLPAAGVFAAYTYSYDPATQTIWLQVSSSFSKKGTVRILSPWESDQTTKNINISSLKITKDSGKNIPYQIEKRNGETYFVFSLDMGNSRIVLQFREEEGNRN